MGFKGQGLPLDRFVNIYFRKHKSLGSNDRRAIAEAVYGTVRWRRLIEATGGVSWERCKEFDPSGYVGKLSNDVACSFPKKLYDLLMKHYGGKKALQIGLISNSPAPVTIRVNTLKTDRKSLLKAVGGNPCKLSDVGIVFEDRRQLMHLPEFQAGHFELQDEGSQLLADLVEAKPGDQVLDFCAGSGGKSLAIATRMKGKGQLFLHDVRKRPLYEARKRMKRAGVQNYQLVFSTDQLQKKMDWILVDAPCSGSGTWRRNPDRKWRFEVDELERLVALQREIMQRAIAYGDRIVYATCSLFPEENEEQVEYFKKEHGLKVEKTFQSLPEEGGMDGFYGVVLTR